MNKLRILFSYLLIISIATFSTILFTNNKAQAASPIYINDKSFTLEIDHYKTIRVKGTTKKATFNSSNSWVASVSSNGKVFAKAPGTTTITASVNGTKIKCKVTVIHINKKSITLTPGKTSTLKITGTKNKVAWDSSNESIATVSDNGKITAKTPGIATITAYVNGKEVTSKITVVDISNKSFVLELGSSSFRKELKINGTKSKITWTSNNKSIATVSSSGLVTAKGAGTTKITASIDGVKLTSTVKIIEISSKTFTLEKGDIKKLEIYGTTEEIIWSSTNESIATISNDGTVTSLSAGTATIIGYVHGINVRAKFTVQD